MLKRLAATTMLGLALVGASVQQAYANVSCFGARYVGSFVDEYGDTWWVFECDVLVIW